MTSGEMFLTIDDQIRSEKKKVPKCIHVSDLWFPTLKKTGFGFSPFSRVVFSENLCRSSLLFFCHWKIDLG